MSGCNGNPHFLAFDVGTSALKAVLYSEDGHVLRSATDRYDYLSPRPGWAEADPEQWWQALVNALAALRSDGCDLMAIQAIGLTGQMHTPVLLDAKGTAIDPTILWLDRRAHAETEELLASTGLAPFQLSSTYTLPKLLWLKRHQPEVLDLAVTLLWPKDYLRFLLTGRKISEINEAAGAGLLDWEQKEWVEERLTSIGIDPSILPTLLPSTADAGPLIPNIAADLGLNPSAKVIVGAGDVIALLGGAPPLGNTLNCSLGSSSMYSLGMSDGQNSLEPDGRLYVYPFLPYPLLNGVSSTSGASLTWAWQSLFSQDKTFIEVLESALTAPAGADDLIFLPFLAGERSPYWNEAMRGGFYGLNLGHRRTHMVRAVLEGVAYSIRHMLDIFVETAPPINALSLAGGGATTPGWAQIIADVCQKPVSIFAGEDTVTRPLFAFARVALDPSQDFTDALACTFNSEPEICLPDEAMAAIYEPLYQRYLSLTDFICELTHKYLEAGVIE